MEAKWRNLLVIAAVVAIAAGILFLLPKADAFSQNLAKINSYWAERSIDPYSMTEAGLRLVKAEDLSGIQIKLNGLRNGLASEGNGSEASVKLAEIHIKFAESLKEAKELNLLLSETRNLSSEGICANLGKYEEMNSLTKGLAQKIREKNSAINSFSSAYPEKAKEANVSRMLGDESALDSSKSDEGLAELKGLC